MMDDETQFVRIFQGKRVKLTLKTSSYVGVVQHINCTDKSIVLSNVARGNKVNEIIGRRLFYGHEILNVEFEGSVKNGIVTEYLDNQLKVKQFQAYRKTTYHADDEDDGYINFEVIDEFHEKFGPAIMTIKKQHVVAVGADGMEIFKHGRLCWLQIATKNKIYLFDILLLGARAFKNGLSMILENRHILKVIHDCRAIAGCLMKQFRVKLTNVFDTQVADTLCFHSETGGHLPNRVSTLQEVVSLHLKVPRSHLLSLKTKSQLTKEESEMWYTRPCPLPLMKVMALSVIHLQPLRMVLLDSLLTDYMALVDAYLSNSQYPRDDFESINLESMFELPAEFRQIEYIRSARWECAVKRYPVTDKGLLARFSPKMKPKLQAQSQRRTSRSAKELKCTEPTVELLPTEDKNPSITTQNVPPLEPVAKSLSDPVRELPLSAGGSEFTALLMGVMGRGRPFGKEQPVPSQGPHLDSDATGINLKMEDSNPWI
ncbi:piRNA biogenesis protein EXD1 [Stigmatopora argus]